MGGKGSEGGLETYNFVPSLAEQQWSDPKNCSIYVFHKGTVNKGIVSGAGMSAAAELAVSHQAERTRDKDLLRRTLEEVESKRVVGEN